MRLERAQSRLRDAQNEGRLVTISRRRGWDVLHGVVVATGPKWFLLAVEYDAGFYGHSILRTRDLTAIRTQQPSFVRQALAHEGYWPMPALAEVDTTGSTKRLIRSVAATDRLVAFHCEASEPDACLVGKPRHIGKRKVTFQTVDTHARWDSAPTKIAYRGLTRFDIGDPYLNRLQDAISRNV